MVPRGLRAGWVALALAAVVATAGPLPARAAAAPAAQAPPKVAIIVGPAGTDATRRYRQAADAAAAVARTLSPDVVRVYSPDATWPAVRAAVTGASVVVYLGHGNGWPSRYSDTLRPRSVDGFGLNPVAGVDDIAHQYFGEAFVSTLRLAPGAVVLLHHLCYASGATEPGLEDGPFGDVLSRVDNFAAGFLAAGASTVIAEGHRDPADLIAAAIRGSRSAARAWASATWGHGHAAAYPSARTPGATLTLDPDAPGAGYYRSMAVGPGGPAVAPAGPAGGPPDPAGPPSLAAAGAEFGTAGLEAPAAPGGAAAIAIPVTRGAAALPQSPLVGVRWLPLVAQPPPAGATTDDGLIVGEARADVIETAAASLSGGALRLSVPAPATPGTYVVLLTLQAADGTPYDVATQALLRPFTVVVPRPLDLRMTGPASVSAPAGAPVSLEVGLANTGTEAWGSPLYLSMWSDPALDPALEQRFSGALWLTATWLSTSTGAVLPGGSAPLPRGLGAPGGSAEARLRLTAPPEAGPYLLLLSLAVHGDLGEFPRVPLMIPAAVGPPEPGEAGYPARTDSPPVR